MFAQQALYLLSHIPCFVSSFRTHLPQHLQHLPNCILTHLTPSQMLESEVPSIAVLEIGSCITISLNRWHQSLIYCTRSSSPQHAVEKGLTDSVSKPRKKWNSAVFRDYTFTNFSESVIGSVYSLSLFLCAIILNMFYYSLLFIFPLFQ